MADKDTRSLASWYRQWRTPLRKFLGGRGNLSASDLDDAAQEVFLRLIRYERSELVENPQAYLYKIASNVAAEWSIRSRHSRPHDSKWLLDLTAPGRPDQGLDKREIQEEVERALLTLAPREREVLKLQFYSGLRRIEIADRLGLSERVVKRILMKSYRDLRERLDPDLLRGFADECE